jgi:hypothetical protein
MTLAYQQQIMIVAHGSWALLRRLHLIRRHFVPGSDNVRERLQEERGFAMQRSEGIGPSQLR